MANDVKVLKLTTGEELFARVERDGNTLILNEVILLRAISGIESETGRIEMELLPWIYSGKGKNIKLSLSHVLVEDDVSEQHKEKYLETIKLVYWDKTAENTIEYHASTAERNLTHHFITLGENNGR